MACTVVGRGEEGPLYDPGSELYYWEGESIASIINGMGKKKEVNWLYYCCAVIRYPSMLHRSRTRSGLYYAIGPCTTSLVTGQYEMIVVELAELP